MGLFKQLFNKEKKAKLDEGLAPSKKSFFDKLSKAVVGKSKVDDSVLDELEEVLIASDVGVATTLKIIQRIEQRVARDKYLGTDELQFILREEIAALLQNQERQADGPAEVFSDPGKKPFVIMVVGVNGVGKTTTIGKLAAQYKAQGLKVVLGAADTFRAAAIDQLQIWADRTQTDIVKQKMGSDPASVAFETLTYAQQQGADVVLVDTAGRLHNKVNLMNELSKIKRVMDRVVADAPHEVMLVLDGSTGQNAFEQAKQFTAATEVTALAIQTRWNGQRRSGYWYQRSV